MTPRGKGLLVEYVVRDLRGLEQNGQLRTVKGIPFKTAAAARAYRAKLPTGWTRPMQEKTPVSNGRGLAYTYNPFTK